MSGEGEESPAAGAVLDGDGGCCVCAVADAEEDNPIVFCDGCDIGVHQLCYGLAEVPDGDWFCDVCTKEGHGKSAEVACVACPVKGKQAFKPVRREDGEDGGWIHVTCVVWHPNIAFEDRERMDAVIDPEETLLRQDRNRVCQFCQEKGGSCVSCSNRNCRDKFHPLCARKHGRNYYVSVNTDGVPVAYCKNHADNALESLPPAKTKAAVVPTVASSRSRRSSAGITGAAAPSSEPRKRGAGTATRGRKSSAASKKAAAAAAAAKAKAASKPRAPIHRFAPAQIGAPVILDKIVEEERCQACGSGDWTNENRILFCDGCDAAVHQQCYGVAQIPEGEWYCLHCQMLQSKDVDRTPGNLIASAYESAVLASDLLNSHKRTQVPLVAQPSGKKGTKGKDRDNLKDAPQEPARCSACPVAGLCMVRNGTNGWVHAACARWLPEWKFSDTKLQVAVSSAKLLAKPKVVGRNALYCSLCGQTRGCLQCSYPKCYASFHPLCARAADWFVSVDEEGWPIAYCGNHTDYFFGGDTVELDILTFHPKSLYTERARRELAHDPTVVPLPADRVTNFSQMPYPTALDGQPIYDIVEEDAEPEEDPDDMDDSDDSEEDDDDSTKPRKKRQRRRNTVTTTPDVPIPYAGQRMMHHHPAVGGVSSHAAYPARGPVMSGTSAAAVAATTVPGGMTYPGSATALAMAAQTGLVNNGVQQFAAHGAASATAAALPGGRHQVLAPAAAAPPPVDTTQQLLALRTQFAQQRSRFLREKWDLLVPFFTNVADTSVNGPLAMRLLQPADGTPSYLGLQHQAIGLGGGSLTFEKIAELAAKAEAEPSSLDLKHIDGELRTYQRQGVAWMLKQHSHGAGGILGDEMGLGKTLQVISFLGYLLYVLKQPGPHMVVAPLSVLPSWQREAKRWCPQMRVVSYHGPENERARIRREELIEGHYDILVTTYEVVTADFNILSRRFFHYLVLDEAQRIKNEKSLIGQAIRRIRTVQRLLLTGTPLQNNLRELWSLLNFLYPEVFARPGVDTSTVFSEAFKVADAAADGSQVNQDVLNASRRLLEPLMIRRIKRDVLAEEIPPKEEIVLYVPMSPMQRFFYRHLLLQNSATLQELGAGAQDRKPVGQLANLLMQLRKCCNHPFLFDGAELEGDGPEKLVTSSGKMMVLDKLLRKLQREGRKALLFSNFTMLLDIVQDYCHMRKYKHLRLDGSVAVARRKYQMELFNQPDSDYFLFLISTRAGGLGINLQAADTVILFDSDWNPSIDMQAIDRAHRIGQKKVVKVYRLITQGSCEERVLYFSTIKAAMSNAVLEGDDADGGDTVGEENDANQASRVKSRFGNALKGIIAHGAKSILATNDQDDQNAFVKAIDAIDVDKMIDKSRTHQEEVAAQAEARAKAQVQAQVQAQAEVPGQAQAAAPANAALDTLDDDDDNELQELSNSLPSLYKLDGVDYNSTVKKRKSDAHKMSHLAEIFASDVKNKKTRDRRSTVAVVKTDEAGLGGQIEVSRWSLELDRKAEEEARRARKRAEERRHKTARFHASSCQICSKTTDDVEPYQLLLCKLCPSVAHITCTRLSHAPHGGWVCRQHVCRHCQRNSGDAGGLLFRCVSCSSAECFDCKLAGFTAVDRQDHPWTDEGFNLPVGYEYVKCGRCNSDAAAAAEDASDNGNGKQQLRRRRTQGPRSARGKRARTPKDEEIEEEEPKVEPAVEDKDNDEPMADAQVDPMDEGADDDDDGGGDTGAEMDDDDDADEAPVDDDDDDYREDSDASPPRKRGRPRRAASRKRGRR